MFTSIYTAIKEMMNLFRIVLIVVVLLCAIVSPGETYTYN